MRLFPGLRNDGRGSNHTSPRRSRRPGPRDRRSAPCLEPLERRTVLSQVILTVGLLADSGPGTLRAAILAADAGSHSDKFTIGFSVTGTIDLQTPLPDLSNTIAVQGPGAGTLTVERASGVALNSWIVTVDAGQTASLSGLTIANGDAGGIYNKGGTMTVSGCTLSGDVGTYGGAIDNGGTMTVSGSTLSCNSATGLNTNGYHRPGRGGGIDNSDNAGGGSLTIRDSLFSGDSAELGGAIYNDSGYDLLNVRGSTFSGNSASDVGGALDNERGTATIQGSTLSGNTAGSEGGGIFNDTFAILVIDDSVVGDNSAPLGVDLYNLGSATLHDSTVDQIGP